MLARNKRNSALKVYKSYNFIDKDPIIDYARTKVFTNGGGLSKVSKSSGVAYGTMNSWFNGQTRRPQFATVAAVLIACGETTLDLKKLRK